MERLNINYEKVKESFLSVFLFGLVAHGYGMLNLIMSHDSLNDIFIASHAHKISIGRIWFPAYVTLAHNKLMLPWLNGMLALVWISLSVYLICNLFNLKEKWQTVFVSAVMTVNPTIISLIGTFAHDTDADMFALLLSVVTVILWRKAGKLNDIRRKGLLLLGGALILSFSIGIYQAFISVFIALVLMLSILDLLEKEGCLSVLKRGLLAIGMIGGAGVFYLLEIKMVTFVMQMGLSSGEYNSVNNLSGLRNASIFQLVVKTYLKWLQAFVDSGFSFSLKVYASVNIMLLVLLAIILIKESRKIGKWERGLVIALAAVMPFGMNVCYLLSVGTLHDVMKYSFWLTYVFLMVLTTRFCQDDKKRFIRLAVICLVGFLTFGWIQTSNAVYVKKELESQATLSRMTRVAQLLSEQEGYVPGETKVVFWGNNTGFTESINGFENQSGITGSELFSTATYQYTYKTYFEYVLNIPLNYVFNQYHVIEEDVMKMPLFPNEGCIRWIDDILVIRFD